MEFRSYDSLRIFDAVARSLSVTKAADELNQSKGSVSYQIAKLESELGFDLFHRSHARLSLTEPGRRLWHVSQAALVQIDREISELRGGSGNSVTVGMLTYFAARWLSPRLTRFFEANPGISLRVEPLNSIGTLKSVNVDLAILWGLREWPGLRSELLFACPAIPTANRVIADEVGRLGIEQAVQKIPLLADSSGDVGWRAWHEAAGLPYRPNTSSLHLPDSNSRVQAVIDGQGLGLWDNLVGPEMEAGTLVAVSDIQLESCGYYVIHPVSGPKRKEVSRFRNWLFDEVAAER
ncbi:MAG: LysR family transcriptional regulator [Alphaproteobacteria bacterium]|nr:LysR family transcriptional regulator [Alphaproteobacteria bacterium]